MKYAIGLALCLAFLAADVSMAQAPDRKPADKNADGSIEVEIVGVVRTGLMAIGGETTGSTISAKGFTWELDLTADKEFAALAEKFNGKELVVKGSLTIKEGVERGRRVIVVAKSVRPPTK